MQSSTTVHSQVLRPVKPCTDTCTLVATGVLLLWLPAAPAAAAAAAFDLFGHDLKTTTCTQFRQTIISRGAVLLHEADKRYLTGVDPELLQHGGGEGELGVAPGRRGARFRADKLLKGADQIELRCLANGQISSVRYRLPNEMDAGHVERVMGMVASKYGQPAGKSEDDGAAAYLWRRGEVSLIVSRSFPQTTVYILYSISGRDRLYREETRSIMRQDARGQAERQKDAF